MGSGAGRLPRWPRLVSSRSRITCCQHDQWSNRAAAIKEYLPKNVSIIQYIRLVGERFGALSLVKAHRASHRGKETSNFCPIVRNL